MLRVALTGGIATGKSHVLARFRALGAPTIDADDLVHEALAADSSASVAIARELGADVLAADGSVNRKMLGRRVFEDPAARRTLEAILHPRVYASIQAWFAGLTTEGARLGIAAIPLLFETHHESDFDVVVATACDSAQQVQRVMQRDGLTEEETRRRIAAQLPIEEKVRRATFVVWTTGTPAETDRQVDEVFERLKRRAEPGLGRRESGLD